MIRTLRQVSFEVKDIKEEKLHGTTDKEILNLAFKENRIIITHDKDFAQVISTNIRHKGIILLRFRKQNPENVAQNLIKVLKSSIAEKIPDKLTIISETQVVIHSHSK
ncbi:MAG: DUF5615 family PIN-like protein [Candidatus Aenigmarchaeota archaeon]|nr:DUF5615 family PIN-like protein [Candidatus Aenigmarchaeota archaeon]